MRSWTTAEEHAYDSSSPVILVKVEVRDSGGTLREWTDIDGRGRNIVTAVEWGDNLGQNGAAGVLRFDWKPAEHDNLSPFWGSGRFSDYLDVVRDVVVSIKVVPPSTLDASGFSWLEVFRASVDDVDLSANPGALPLRDLILAELMDGFITANKAYGADDGSVDVDTVAAALLSDYDKEGNTIAIPVANEFQVKRYVQQKAPILRAIADLYFQSGWDVRPKWNTAAGAFKLTAYEPDRTPGATSHTFPAGHVARFTQFSIAASNIRNWVKVYFGDSAQVDEYGNDTRTYVERLASTSPAHDSTGTPVASSSIDKYKWRFMSFAEASTSLIDTTAKAQAFADAALADLADPTFLGAVELKYLFWPVELNDFYEFEADGLRFGSNQDFAVTGYTHSIDFGSGSHKTVLTLQGKPSLGRDQYFARASMPGGAAPVDDVAPSAPTVTLRQTPLGVTASVEVTGSRDYDQVLFFVGPRADFTPSRDSLRQASRSREYTHNPRGGAVREWLKVQLRDRTGNLSASAGPFALVGKKTDARQLSQPMQAKTQLGFYANKTITGYGEIVFDKYVAGEFLGDYNLATGRFYARDGGTYRVAMSAKMSTSMVEATDYYISAILNPDTDALEVGRATVTGGIVQLETFVPLDADDELEIQFVDPGGGSWSNATLSTDYSTLKIELSGTQQRSKPYPFVEADPVFLDHGPIGTYSSANGACHAVARLRNGEVVFTNGAAGAAYPARLHRNEVDTAKARSVAVSGSSDYWLAGVAEDEDRNLYFAMNRVDATANYSIVKFDGGLTQQAVGSDLTSSVEPRAVAYAPSSAEPNVYLGTKESTAGKIREYSKSLGAAAVTSGDLGGPVNSLARLVPDDTDGGLVVAILSSATAPDIVALPASNVAGSEEWRIQLDTLTPAGTSTDRSELKTSPLRDRLYAIGGETNPALYCIAPTGDVVFTRDLGSYSTLADVTGCLSLDVHPTTGDVAVLCYYDNAGAVALDCVIFDPDGNARWSWRELGDLDPADDPDWTASTSGHRIAFATDGAIWISNGGASSSSAKVIRPYSEIPDNPPSILASMILADFDAEALDLADGAAVAAWPSKRGVGANQSRPWHLANATTVEQPKFRGRWEAATVDSVARVQTEFAAVEFDGTERLIGSQEDTLVADGALCVLVCEPVDATGDYFSGYADAGSASAPLVELVNTAGRLTLNLNVDGVQDTSYDHVARAGLQAVGVRGADHTGPGLWLSNTKPNQASALAGSDASPDGNPRIRLGQAGNSSGDWFAGWVYRWIWLRPSGVSASRLASVLHWARAYYGIAEVAVEDVQTAPGDTIAYVTRTQYYSHGAGNDDIVVIRGITDGFLIGCRGGSSSVPHVKRVPTDGGAATWTMSASNLSATAGLTGAIDVDAAETKVWVAVDGSDGVTYGAANSMLVLELDIADGTQNAVVATSASGGGSALTQMPKAGGLNETDGDFLQLTTFSADELRQFSTSTLAEDAVSGNDTQVVQMYGGCPTPDNDYFVGVGGGGAGSTYMRLARFALPLSSVAQAIDGGTSNYLDLNAVDTTYSNNAHGLSYYPPKVVRARDGSNTVWIAPGYFGNQDQKYLLQYDPGSHTIISEIDIAALVGITPASPPTTEGHVVDVCVDKYGYIYALYINNDASSDADVVRLQPDGTFDLSFATEGVTLPVGADTTNAITIGVSDDDDPVVMIGDDDGYAWFYTQT